jgi:hypothetical protein
MTPLGLAENSVDTGRSNKFIITIDRDFCYMCANIWDLNT